MKSKAVVEEKPSPGADLIDAYRKDFQTRAKLALLPGAQEAFERFAAHGLPSTRTEAFRKTDLGPIRHKHHTLAVGADVTEKDVQPFLLRADARIVLVDGVVVPKFSVSADGATVAALAHGAAANPAGGPTGSIAATEAPERALWALNHAFARDVALVHIGKDAVAKTIQVLHLSSAQAQTVRHPRVLIAAEPGAQATVVETYASLAPGAGWTNAVTETDVAPNARLTHVRLLFEDAAAIHTAAATARVARDATYHAFSLTTGAARARIDLHATLAAQGAHARLNGVFLAARDQLIDHHTVIDHTQPDGTSHEDFKGILTDKAHGVFNGSIIVRPDAQRTASEQENRNLILSRDALVDTTPQLEIHADDVKCSHGSTIGRLDEKQLFYLRTRGISAEHARRTLTLAFAAEAYADLDDAMRKRIDEHVAAWFQANEGGA